MDWLELQGVTDLWDPARVPHLVNTTISFDREWIRNRRLDAESLVQLLSLDRHMRDHADLAVEGLLAGHPDHPAHEAFRWRAQSYTSEARRLLGDIDDVDLWSNAFVGLWDGLLILHRLLGVESTPAAMLSAMSSVTEKQLPSELDFDEIELHPPRSPGLAEPTARQDELISDLERALAGKDWPLRSRQDVAEAIGANPDDLFIVFGGAASFLSAVVSRTTRRIAATDVGTAAQTFEGLLALAGQDPRASPGLVQLHLQAWGLAALGDAVARSGVANHAAVIQGALRQGLLSLGRERGSYTAQAVGVTAVLLQSMYLGLCRLSLYLPDQVRLEDTMFRYGLRVLERESH